MKFNGVNNDAIRGQNATQTGCKFTYTDAATVTMSVDGSDSKAVVIVKSGTDIFSVTISASLTCALTTSGAGGLDTGSEASDTGYYIFLISKPQGKTPVLLCSTSSTSPTMPSGYTHRSTPIWFISNDGSSNIRKFIDINGTCFYNEQLRVGAGLLGYSSWTLIDCSAVVPNKSVAYMWSLARNKSDSTVSSIRIHTNNSDTQNGAYRTTWIRDFQRSYKYSHNPHLAFEHPFVNSATGLYYQWNANPGSGGSNVPGFWIDVRGWAFNEV